MQVQNCKRCGKVFSSLSKTVCPNCEKEEEAAFMKVKEFIRENSHCSLQEISDATEVSSKRILKFIRDGRLVISEGLQGEVVCDQCGRPIRTGRYCDSCIITITAEVDEIFGRNKSNIEFKREGARMRSGIHKKL